MKLAMELPTAYLAEFSPLCDCDFALAQEVLEDKAYAAFYKEQRARGRFVIMDNGFHELGHPLDIPSLIEAALLINPSVIIAPDWLGEAKKTFDGFETALGAIKGRWGLAVVMQGRDRVERHAFFHAVVSRCAMLCFPFKEARLLWLTELIDAFPEVKWPRIHLLGVNELQELDQFRQLFFQTDVDHGKYVSVDTAKPIKWALQGKRISAEGSVRGSRIKSSDIAKAEKLTPTTKQDFFYNVAYLRKYL